MRTSASWVVVGLLCGLLAGVAACSSDGGSAAADSDAGEPLEVVVSTSVIADWTRQIGGDAVQVTTLVAAGADAHTLQLEPSQAVALSEADLVILNGGGLEASFRGVIDENAGGPIVTLADDVDLVAFAGAGDREPDSQPDGGAETDAGEGLGRRDPHFWLDPNRAIIAIGRIRDELIVLDAGSAEAFGARAAAYIDQVRAVDAEVAAALGALPPAHRVLVTFHDAYGYFARHYGLKVLGFVVEGPEEEPSAADLAAVVRAIEQAGVAFIYREPQFSAGVVDRVAAETGATVRTIYSLPTGDVEDYLGLLRANGAALSD